MKSFVFTIVIVVSVLYSLCSQSAQAVERPKRSIGAVMDEAMKGSNSLYRKVSLGQGSDADIATLLDLLGSLPAETPPQGEGASWKEKTSKLIAALEAVAAKKPNATSQLQLAGNCKACHSVHKGD